jgi:integrase
MVSALTCNGSRVLTPGEATSIRRVISKPSNRALFDLMLYSGLRLEEVRQLVEHPEIFDEERRLLVIKSGKAKASQKSRNVILSDKGVEAVRAFLQAPKMPASSSAWQTNLIRWSKIAGLSPLPGRDNEGGNVYGITVRTSRKSLESWLLTAYPDRAAWIALSQGHTETTALGHYLNVSFTDQEREDIIEEVRGWRA